MANDIVTLTAGEAWIDHGTSGLSMHWYASAKAAGKVGVILDCITNGVAADVAAARQAGLAIMLFQGYDPQAFTDIAQATSRAQQARNFANQVGYPQGAVIWLDWESVPSSVTVDDGVRWINTWANVVQQAGFLPGIYVGADQPLTADDLYNRLTLKHYWHSCSASTVDVATRGYQIIQTACNVQLNGVSVDEDTIETDHLGDTPVAWAPHPASVQAAPTAAPNGPDLTALQATVDHLTQRVDAMEKGLTQAGQA